MLTGIDNIEIDNIVKDITYQSKEIQKHLKSLPRDKYDFLLDELITYAGSFSEYMETVTQYIVNIEQQVSEFRNSEICYEGLLD